MHRDGGLTRSIRHTDRHIGGFPGLAFAQVDVTGSTDLDNLGTFRIWYLADTVIVMTRSTVNLSFQFLSADGRKHWRPDIRASREQIEWEPNSLQRAGFSHTIGHLGRLLSAGTN